MSSVLYDAQGPRAKRRNMCSPSVFLAVLLAACCGGSTPCWTRRTSWSGPCGSPSSRHRSLEHVPLAGPRQHAQGRGALHGHRTSARARPRYRPAVRPRLGTRPGRHCGGVLPRHPGAVPDDLRHRTVLAEYTNVNADDRPLYAVVTGLVLYNASVLAEIVRAGILSLPKGQSEAAHGGRSAQEPGDAVHPAAAGGHGDAAGDRQPARGDREGHGARWRDPHLHRPDGCRQPAERQLRATSSPASSSSR